MKKTEMEELLLGLLRKNNSMFPGILWDDMLDALVVHSVDGERFILSVDYLEKDEEAIRLWAKRKPVSLSIGISLVQMENAGIISEGELINYLSEVLEKADELQHRFDGRQG